MLATSSKHTNNKVSEMISVATKEARNIITANLSYSRSQIKVPVPFA